MKIVKAFGLAALVALAVSLPATASAATFHSEPATTLLLRAASPADQTYYFPNGAEGGSVGGFTGCEGDLFGYNTLGDPMPSSTIRLDRVENPGKIRCAYMGMSVWWETSTCKFQFNVGTVNPMEGTLSLVGCEKPMTLAMVGCKFEIGNQTLGPVTYQNQGSGSTRSVLATSKITHMTFTGWGQFCGGWKTPSWTSSTGELKGSWELRASDLVEGIPRRGLWIS